MEEGRYRPNRSSALQIDQRPPQRHRQQGHYECGLQHAECLGDRGAPCSEGESTIQKVVTAVAAEEGTQRVGAPSTSAKGQWR